jgi:Uma2 family endonuclease
MTARGSTWFCSSNRAFTLIPDWVAEVLSPSTEASDRTEKLAAFGAMGVGWLWLLDTDRRTLETFANVRGRMTPGPIFGTRQAVTGDPFGPIPVPVDPIFV